MTDTPDTSLTAQTLRQWADDLTWRERPFDTAALAPMVVATRYRLAADALEAQERPSWRDIATAPEERELSPSEAAVAMQAALDRLHPFGTDPRSGKV